MQVENHPLVEERFEGNHFPLNHAWRKRLGCVYLLSPKPPSHSAYYICIAGYIIYTYFPGRECLRFKLDLNTTRCNVIVIHLVTKLFGKSQRSEDPRTTALMDDLIKMTNETGSLFDQTNGLQGKKSPNVSLYEIFFL